MLTSFAWNDVQLFLAVYRAGTMGRAAADLRIDTSTISRRLNTLEDALGTELFERSRSGLRPTEAAEDLLSSAEWIEEGVMHFARAADGLHREVAGTVRVACPPDAASVVLLPVVEKLFTRYPDLGVALLPGEATLDMARRDADIALRISRPDRGELVAKQLGDIPWAVAGAGALAARVASGESWQSLPWIDWCEGEGPPALRHWMKQHGGRAVLRTSHMPTQISAASRGIGLVLLPEPSVEHYGLTEVELPEGVAKDELGQEPLYLVAHRMMRQVPRVRVVWDALVEALSAQRV